MFKVKKKEDLFYDYFIEFAEKIHLSGTTFDDLVRNYTDVANKVATMKNLESACDQEVHKILKALNESFITPLDREDMLDITRCMDEIVNSIEEVSNRFDIFSIKAMRNEAMQMSSKIMEATKEMIELFKLLPDKKNANQLRELIIEINRIENEGDVVYRTALKVLFSEEKDAIELMKWTKLLEGMEHALDCCEIVANIVEGVVMKNA